MSEIIKQENQIIVKPDSDVVASMADDFKAELLNLVQDSEGMIVIDLSGIEMVDSVGIGVIIATHNTLNKSGRELKVINVAPDIYNLFSTMRLNRHFTVEKIGSTIPELKTQGFVN